MRRVSTVTIRRGGAADAARVLALFDEAVVWLVGGPPRGRRRPGGARRGRRAAARRLLGRRPPLVAWYERQGFQRSGTFDVGGWIGQVFAMRL